MSLPESTIELDRGYIDNDGDHHRVVTVRAPTLQDEIESEKKCKELGWDPDGTGGHTTMLARCIVHWEGIPQPQLKHLTALSRVEATRLVSEMITLENKLSEVETGNDTSESGDTS